MALAALSERLLGLLAARRHPLDLALQRRSRRAHAGDGVLRLHEPRAAHPQLLTGDGPAGLQCLALQPLVQLGRLRLALERTQARARLAFNVERAVEVLLGALELQLGAPSALAVLAEPGRLLDQQTAVARLGGHDRLDPALRDHRVRLLAEARVREQLEHVHEAAVRAVEAVLALPGAVVAAQDRDLGGAVGDRLIAVVEHQLHLRLRARLDAPPAGEDHIRHRVAADRQRRLLAERP